MPKSLPSLTQQSYEGDAMAAIFYLMWPTPILLLTGVLPFPSDCPLFETESMSPLAGLELTELWLSQPPKCWY